MLELFSNKSQFVGQSLVDNHSRNALVIRFTLQLTSNLCFITQQFTDIINVKKIAFVNKEHTTDKKMGVLVLLRLFISSNEVRNTAYAL